MRADVVARLAVLLEQYATGRADQRWLWANVRALRCEFIERGSDEPGDDGTPPCYLGSDRAEWCATCQKRDPIFQEYRKKKRANRRQLAQIERVAARLLVPDVVEPAPEPGPLLEMMGADS